MSAEQGQEVAQTMWAASAPAPQNCVTPEWLASTLRGAEVSSLRDLKSPAVGASAFNAGVSFSFIYLAAETATSPRLSGREAHKRNHGVKAGGGPSCSESLTALKTLSRLWGASLRTPLPPPTVSDPVS